MCQKLTLLLALFCLSIGSINAQSQATAEIPYYQIEVPKILQQGTVAKSNNKIPIKLPLPNGEWANFEAKTNTLYPADHSSAITSYDLQGVNNLLAGKLTIGNGKLWAVLRLPEGMAIISPSTKQLGAYKSFFGNDPENDTASTEWECGQELEAPITEEFKSNPALEKSNSGFVREGELKIYRLAIVTTGEFYVANGGNRSDVEALVAFTVNAWNLIYERDLGVSFELTQLKIYEDFNTDPFIPDNQGGASRADQAVEITVEEFGFNAFDIGHVFHNTTVTNGWSGGGVAYLGVVCSSFKGGGWSSSFDNTGVGWLDLSAHEVGHQFNAPHTFNGSGNSCSGRNISSSNSYEIGSGSTIMSYNGICGPGQNIPSGSDADLYFHSSSLDRMIRFISNGPAANCGRTVPTGNLAPFVTANPSRQTYSIPARTPFELTGQALDFELDKLTYVWEQYDEDGPGTPTQGLIGSAAAANPRAPLFRSFPPSTSPSRTFPSLRAILDGNNNGQSFEALPAVDRTIDFAFIVRDNSPLGGATVCDNTTLEVVDTGTPFEITSQNQPATLTADGTTSFTINWNVAGTTGNGINSANVDILFSKDGGLSFPFTLVANTPNDGTAILPVPAINTKTGRIKIQASDNIFFDINNANIEINSSCDASGTIFTPDATIQAKAGSSDLSLDLSPVYGNAISRFRGTLSPNDPSTSLVFDNARGNCFAVSNSSNFRSFSFQPSRSGIYAFNFTGQFGQLINIYEGAYNKSNICAGWLASTATRPSGTGSVSLSSSVSVGLQEGLTYTLVFQTFSNNSNYYGNFEIRYNGQGVLLSGTPAPSPQLDYTYVIFENFSTDILAFDDEPDLSSFEAGEYLIQGLSYESTATVNLDWLNTTYIGSSFENLQNDLLSLSFCGDLSNNTKSVSIFPDCGAEAGKITMASNLVTTVGSPVLALDLAPDFSMDTPPPSTFAYTFIVFDVQQKIIVGFSDTPDLSNPLQYVIGQYEVYGFSYDPAAISIAALENTFAGAAFTRLNFAINTGSICADLSDNFKSITLVACEAEGATFLPDNAITATPGEAVLDLSLAPAYGFLSPDPGANYNYTYLIVRANAGTIVAFEDDPDLSNTALYGGGEYLIYGLSYENRTTTTAELNNSYVESTVASFRSVLSNQVICGDLSNNTKRITIVGCIAEAGAIQPDSDIVTAPGSEALMLSLSPNYSNTINPGNAYGYTYLIVEEATDSILFIEEMPDLRDTAVYTFGNYLIYGLSYEVATNLPNSFLGFTIAELQELIRTTDICIDLSSNTKSIRLIECSANGVTFSPADTLFASSGEDELNLNLLPNYDSITPNPGNDYSYAFVTVLNGSDIIVAVEDQPDLRPYPSGVFIIYGLSYENSSTTVTSLNNTYANLPLSTLQTAITDGIICADFSSNTKQVVVGACVANGGVIVPSDTLLADVGSETLIFDLSPDYSLTFDPGLAYGYAYIVLNESSQIEAIVEETDLSDATTYSGGRYEIYGISYELRNESIASLNATFQGATFEALNTAITDRTICADLSDNSKIVFIIGCMPVSGPFAPLDPVTAVVGSPLLNLSLSPAYSTPFTSISGTLESGTFRSRFAVSDAAGSCAVENNLHYNTSISITVDATGDYTFVKSSPSGQLMNIYEGEFTNTRPCDNWLASSATELGSELVLSDTMTVFLNQGVAYTLMMSTNGSNSTFLGDFEITLSGAGNFTDGPVDPGVNYNYTYVIVNEPLGRIIAVADDPNLSEANKYPVGGYSIYGLSYERNSRTTAELDEQYATKFLFHLTEDLADETVCGALSEATKSVTIIAGNLPFGGGQAAQATTESTPTTAQLLLSPNPATDWLTIQLSNNESIQQVKVYNTLGQLMPIQLATDQAINLQQLEAGIYWIVVESAGQYYQQRVVKE